MYRISIAHSLRTRVFTGRTFRKRKIKNKDTLLFTYQNMTPLELNNKSMTLTSEVVIFMYLLQFNN